MHVQSLVRTDVLFRIRLMRYQGRRLPWRDVSNGPSFVGDLRTHLVSQKGRQFSVATLHAADPMGGTLIPELFEPVLDGMATGAFRLRGFERHPIDGGGVYSVLQEWHVETA